jgi:2-haloacid dehalogenase
LVLGSDVEKAYKPDPRAYHTPARFLGLEPGEVMLIAAHPSDLEAAQNAGLATGYVARPDEYGPGREPPVESTGAWDVSGASLGELAGSLFGAPDPR